LWNAARFVLMNAGDERQERDLQARALAEADLNFADRWIRSRLAAVIEEARAAIDSYRFNDYANALYQFTWHEFCDWYIEMSKLSLNAGAAEAARSRCLLVELLEQILLLLHPIMPFVTEEIWHVFGKQRQTIMTQRYPAPEPAWRDERVERDMEILMDAIRAVRNLRTEMNCPPGKEVKVIFRAAGDDLSLLAAHEPFFRALARVGSAEYLAGGVPPRGAATAVVRGIEIYLPLGDLVNVAEERSRLTKEVRKMEEELARVQNKLANQEFLRKAKEAVVSKERQKAEQYQEKIRALNGSLQRLQEID
jgi:valyl-tRNA synthetase